MPRRTYFSRRIKLGYFSGDFCNHPVSYLIVDLLSHLDRDKFEVFAFSYGLVNDDEMSKRIETGVDRFTNVASLTDSDIALIARDNQIDIAIDLGGYTRGSRPGIFVERAAPVQVNWLGFPGTLGCGQVWDYLIADRLLIPEETRPFIAECVAYMPNQFQPNPLTRPIPRRLMRRKEHGLPEGVFVFCCFNNCWKLTPTIFRVWMRILAAVPSSVLWLTANTSASTQSIMLIAQEVGVESGRIIFAPRVGREEYFERYAHANLFLDTYPYNGGTTTSDSLWSGVPVVSLVGASPASRMGLSLLSAVGLPDLAVHTEPDYEALAIQLATDPGAYELRRERLLSQLSLSPLFDTKVFATHLEAVFVEMWSRHQSSDSVVGDIYV